MRRKEIKMLNGLNKLFGDGQRFVIGSDGSTTVFTPNAWSSFFTKASIEVLVRNYQRKRGNLELGYYKLHVYKVGFKIRYGIEKLL